MLLMTVNAPSFSKKQTEAYQFIFRQQPASRFQFVRDAATCIHLKSTNVKPLFFANLHPHALHM